MQNLTEVERIAYQNLDLILNQKELSSNAILSEIENANFTNDKIKVQWLFSKYINAISLKSKERNQ